MTSSDHEEMRTSSLAEAAEALGLSEKDIGAAFAPGTMGCHEAMHMAFVVADMVDRHLRELPAILARPDWHEKVSIAVDALNDVYQAIGAEHSASENGEHSTENNLSVLR